MSRRPEHLTALRQQLGKELVMFRRAAEVSQQRIGELTNYSRTSINKIEHGQQCPDRLFWEQVDDLLNTDGVLLARYEELQAAQREHSHQQRATVRAQYEAQTRQLRQQRQGTTEDSVRSVNKELLVPVHLAPLPVLENADSDYLADLHQKIRHIVELDNRFGGAELAQFAVRFFRSVHHQFGCGAYKPSMERDLQATVGELAEVAGWLLYDADRQDEVRRMNQEALYFSRLAGDRQMELLTIQNVSMHAGFLGRPREALCVVRSVLEGSDRLSSRVKALFTVRKARALAQCGDESSMALFPQAWSLYLDGVRDDDPPWAWWVNECVLTWHEGMALLDLGQPVRALEYFEKSATATQAHFARGRYLHLSHLLDVQVRTGAWRDAESTLSQLPSLASAVASTRTAVLLRGILSTLDNRGAPASIRDLAVPLRSALDVA